jgi:hypothetical protein
MVTSSFSAHRNVSLLLGRMEAHRRVEFTEYSSTTALVGSGFTALVGGDGCTTWQGDGVRARRPDGRLNCMSIETISLERR